MAELKFTLKNGNYESEEFPISKSFNIHVERESEGALGIFQKTEGTQFAKVVCSDAFLVQRIVDVDVEVLVGPKWIKVVSSKPVTAAFYTEDLS